MAAGINRFRYHQKTTIESIGGILGKNVSKGGTDPLMFMDRKYKLTYNIIKKHNGMQLRINTSSDLIGHDDYINILDKENHSIFIYYSTCDDAIGKLTEPGTPSFKRRLKAYRKLLDLGYNVQLVHINFSNLETSEDINNSGGYNTLKINIKLSQPIINRMAETTGEKIKKELDKLKQLD